MVGFSREVSAIFEKHGIKNEQLEEVTKELFESFESYLLRNKNLVKFVKESIEREERLKKEFRG